MMQVALTCLRPWACDGCCEAAEGRRCCLQFQKQAESIAAGDFSQREGSTHINLIEQLKELSLGNGEAAGNGVAHAEEAYGNGLAEDEAVEEREAEAAPGHALRDFAGALRSDE